jgi:hypothetical protein
MGVTVRGVNGSIETQQELVGTACAVAARGPPQPHDELPRAAAAYLAALALAHRTPQAFRHALLALRSLATGTHTYRTFTITLT